MPSHEHAALVAELFKSAAEIAPSSRQAFVAERCGGNTELQREVESLLRAEPRAATFMERAAIDVVTKNERTTAAFVSGDAVGEYEIISLIGKGGMGEVYLANDQRVRRQVALKLVRGGLDREILTRRFQREQELLAALNHPNIAQLYDTGVTTDGVPYFAMEYVAGTRLTEFAKERPLDLPARLHLFRKVCAAIGYAHQHLVIHRDIKPANILVTLEGEPKLLDFGIAKLLDELVEDSPEQTLTIQRMLTPEYASPEQVRGERITTATDVYSLGVVLYELLTETKPFRLTSRRPEEIARAITEEEPLRPSATTAANARALRGDLDNIVGMALRKEPERRYVSARALSEDIRRYLEGLPVRARKDTIAYRASKFVQRNRAGVLVAVLAIAALLTAMYFTLVQKQRADRRFNQVRQMANSLLFQVEGEFRKGPTKAHAELVRQAVAYLHTLAQEVKDEPSLQIEVAAGYLNVGDIQGKPFQANVGDTAGALTSYATAKQILESVRSTPAHNREVKRYLSLALQRIGRIHMRNGAWPLAVENERKAVSLAESLTEKDSAKHEDLSVLAEDYVQLGLSRYQAGRATAKAEYEEAAECFRKALTLHQQLLQKQPTNTEYRFASGIDHEFLGCAYYSLGDWTDEPQYYNDALESFRKRVEIDEALLAAEPANETYRRNRADGIGQIGLAQLKLGLFADALRNFQEKLTVSQALEAADGSNTEARRDVAYARYDVSRALHSLGDVRGGLETAAQACASLEVLLQREPDSRETLVALIDVYNEIAEMQKSAGNYDAASDAYNNALRLLQAWSTKEPANVLVQRLMATNYGALAALHQSVAESAPPAIAKIKWSAAQHGNRQSLSLWAQIQDASLSTKDRARVSEARDHLARCEAALSELR